MKNFIIPLKPNFATTERFKLNLRKLFGIFMPPPDINYNTPLECKLQIQNLDIYSDWMPPLFPQNESRFPVPMNVSAGAPIKWVVRDGEEARFIQPFNLEAEKSLIESQIKSIPYYLVFRKGIDTEGLSFADLECTQRIPQNRFFIPKYSWFVGLYKDREKKWNLNMGTDPTTGMFDKVQIIDRSNEYFAKEFIILQHPFPHLFFLPAHVWTSPEAWMLEVRLQAQVGVHTVLERTKEWFYFIVCGILSTEDELEKWIDRVNFDLIPIK